MAYSDLENSGGGLAAWEADLDALASWRLRTWVKLDRAEGKKPSAAMLIIPLFKWFLHGVPDAGAWRNHVSHHLVFGWS